MRTITSNLHGSLSGAVPMEFQMPTLHSIINFTKLVKTKEDPLNLDKLSPGMRQTCILIIKPFLSVRNV